MSLQRTKKKAKCGELERFKSALRGEIEKMSDEQNYNGASEFDDGQVYAYKEVLKLIESVTPKS